MTDETSEDTTRLPYPVVPQQEALGIVSMICGLVSLGIAFFCCGLVALPFSISGLVFGIVSIRKVNRDPALYAGKSFAIVGIVVSSISLVLGLALLIMFLVAGVGSGMFEEFQREM